MQGAAIANFQQAVWKHYHQFGRHNLPWRVPEFNGSFDPYKILVSEVMLQQTQVARVLPKYLTFTAQFPSFAALAAASLGDVLKTWSGLGYNRRAKFLWQTAGAVCRMHGGRLPENSAELVRLPGIGINTAGAVLAYAFNKPAVFIETNIRTVFIHHFFDDQQPVHDRDVADIVARTLPDNPREWYWALMDYGTFLKQRVGNVSRGSAHYTKQSAFAGSTRQLRGQVLRLLGEGPKTEEEFAASIRDNRLHGVLADLLREGMISKQAKRYTL